MTRKAVLLVDLQTAVFDGKLIPPAYEAQRLLENASGLLNAAREAGMSIVHVQHCAAAGEALEEDGPGWPIYAPLTPNMTEPVVRKQSSSAFQDTNLHGTLQGLGVRSLIVAGIQSEYCVAATCHAALALGYEVQIAEDGHSTWPSEERSAEEIVAEQNRDLKSCGVAVHTTAELITTILSESRERVLHR